MKSIKLMLAGACLLLCCGCGMQVKESTTAVSYTHLTLPTKA